MTYGVVGVVGFAWLSISTAILCSVRRAQRVRDGLRKDDSCEDCCISFVPCTTPCATVQALRQEGLTQHTYELFSTHGGEPAVKLMAVVPV